MNKGFLSGLVFGLTFVIGALAAAIINPLPYIFANGTTADATQVNADFAQIVANVNTNAAPIVGSAFVPSGAVMAFNLGACPSGWIASDGTSGTRDTRGLFVRGLDTGGTYDPGRVLGSYQNQQLQDHTHGTLIPDGTVAASGGAINAGAISADTGIPDSGIHGSETRPVNVALLYCQKS
jgi:hypothetical protein